MMGQALRIVTEVRGKVLAGPEAERVRIEASYGLKASQIIEESSRLQRRAQRLAAAPERLSIAKAMLAVEERLVKAFWTIAKQPASRLAPLESNRNGVSYVHDRLDIHARYSDVPGGKWDSIAPKPSLPSSKEIDAAAQAQQWLLMVDERRRRILVVGATSKRGDAGANINWHRLRDHLPEFALVPTRTLQDRYRQAIREIVTELTLARIVNHA